MSKIALMFPGVGSQHVGMGKEFYENFKLVRETFEEAGDVLKVDLSKLCFETASREELTRLVNAQAALIAVCTALYRVYRQEIGLVPHFCLGHSLGEYSALCAAGKLYFSDALTIVQQRGKILKEVAATMEGDMAWVINLDHKVVEKVCEEYSSGDHRIYVSAYDAPTQSSISGLKTDIWEIIGPRLVNEGAIVYPLKLGGPFHSPYMKKAARQMKSILQHYRFRESTVKVIANQNALPYENSRNSTINNLSQQLVSPIRWQASLQYLVEQQVEIAVEVGPDRVLKHLVHHNTDSIVTHSLEKTKDLKNLMEKLKKTPEPQENYKEGPYYEQHTIQR